jgi:glycerol-3-phosphate dehydrogenase (NAD(P)+)
VERAAVVGSGSWGTALAGLLGGSGIPTVLWAREAEVVQSISERRTNDLFLPGYELPGTVSATGDLGEALAGSGIVVSAVPTQFVRGVFAAASPDPGTLLISVSKGIEVDTLQTPNEILGEVVPGPVGAGVVCVSGPSFAREVAAGSPTAVVAASRVEEHAVEARHLLSSRTFRVYSSDDVVSVELGGALKNVIAIAAGITEGLGFGHNTVAALITRGLAEITRLGVARGGHPLTFAGLSGMGDLVLTCTGALSRNRSVGVEIGKGRRLSDVLGEMTMVAEGVRTTEAAQRLAEREGVDMPITGEVYRVLYEDKDPRTAVLDLMGRTLRDEREY